MARSAGEFLFFDATYASDGDTLDGDIFASKTGTEHPHTLYRVE